MGNDEIQRGRDHPGILWLKILALATIYFCTAKFGLELNAVNRFATLVWPPTGIALAALLLFGFRLWPGVALGAFLVNLFTGAAPLVSLGIAFGNTLEAMAAVALLRRTRFDFSLSRLSDVLRLLVLGALLSTSISASIGVTSLWFGGLIPAGTYGRTWVAWWLGDMMGVLIVTPLILVWAGGVSEKFRVSRAIEIACFLLVSFAIAGNIFTDGAITGDLPIRQSYMIFPILLWGAIRFRQIGATSLVFLTSAFAIFGTVKGYGPFVSGSLSDSLTYLQTFLAVVALTALIIAAVVSERLTEERQLKERTADLATANANLEVMAQASKILSASLDYNRTLQSIAELAVPKFADLCSVEKLEADESLHVIALAHADPAKARLVREIRDHYPPKMKAKWGSPHVIRTGRSELHSQITDPLLEDAAVDGAHLRMIRSLGLKSVIIVPLRTSDHVMGAITFMTAESDHSYTPEDLSIAEELGRRASLAVENAMLYRQSKEAVDARDEFLSIASHELRTPITALYLQLQILHKTVELTAGDGGRSGNAIDEKLAKGIDRAEKAGQRLVSMLDELLDITRVRAGKLTLSFERVDLSELAKTIVRQFSEEAKRSGISISLDVPKEPLIGMWDPNRVAQVLMNLISNAVKYGDGKPIHVMIDSDPGHARAGITVSDQGIGIPEEMQGKIFERFERAVGSSNIAGLGLGLYIVRQIVEAHGGSIHVASAPNQGSKFVVELPLVRPEPVNPTG